MVGGAAGLLQPSHPPTDILANVLAGSGWDTKWSSKLALRRDDPFALSSSVRLGSMFEGNVLVYLF